MAARRRWTRPTNGHAVPRRDRKPRAPSERPALEARSSPPTPAELWAGVRYRLALRLAQRADLFERLLISPAGVRRGDFDWEDEVARIDRRHTTALRLLPPARREALLEDFRRQSPTRSQKHT